MPSVKNMSSQALYLNLLNGRSVKVPARGKAELDEDDLKSPAVLYHLSRGNLAASGRASPLPQAAQLEEALPSWKTCEPKPPAAKQKPARTHGEGAKARRPAPRKSKKTTSAKVSRQKMVKTSPRRKQGEK